MAAFGRARGRGRGRGEILVGNYDPVRRATEVRNRLYRSFDLIRNENLHKKASYSDSQSSCSAQVMFGMRDPEDVFKINLESILAEVETLTDSVEKFKGPHFTKIYRTLQGDCTKLQSDLDRLEVTDRDDLRRRRRETLIRIDGLAKILAAKTHSSGKSCASCEVRE